MTPSSHENQGDKPLRQQGARSRRRICGSFGDYPLEPVTDFADFQVSLRPPANLRRWVKPQVLFYVDGLTPFKPLAIDQAFPVLEWGLNWCVTSHTNHHLIFHAAVIEKQGHALIMPGSPGSGKSTQCGLLRHFSTEQQDFWPALIKRAAELDLNKPLYYALTYTQAILGTPVPENAIGQIGEGVPKGLSAKLMDALFMQALQIVVIACSQVWRAACCLSVRIIFACLSIC